MGVLYEVGSGGGHTMSPTPSPSVTEHGAVGTGVVETVNAATNTNDEVASLFGIQQWSNECNKRFIIQGAATNSPIGKSGIGTWPDEDEDVVEVDSPTGDPQSQGYYEVDTDPTSLTAFTYVLTSDTTVNPNKKYYSEVIDESDWQYISTLSSIDVDNSDEIDVSIKFDPKTNEPIALGGYIIDTDTGRICIKFANTISDTEHARVAIDLTYTRNNIV